MNYSFQSVALVIAALLLWQSCILPRFVNPAISIWLMDAGFLTAIALVCFAFGTREVALKIVGITSLATSLSSYGVWRWLMVLAPVHCGNAAPFSGPVALWSIFTFFLGTWLLILTARVLLKRSQLAMKDWTAAALTVLLFGTSSYFFYLANGA